jgi:hypothetical protein
MIISSSGGLRATARSYCVDGIGTQETKQEIKTGRDGTRNEAIDKDYDEGREEGLQ